jgi:hypothetical protein
MSVAKLNDRQNSMKNEFNERLVGYILSLETQRVDDYEYEQHSELIEMAIRPDTSPSHVIEAFSQAFSEYPTRNLVLLHLMRAIVVSNRQNKQYRYPEFLWIIFESGLLSDSRNINGIMSALADICGQSVLRSYLVHRLITETGRKRTYIIQAFYYTGYTVDTIKIVAEHITSQKYEDKAYVYLYSGAMSLLYGEQASMLSDDDKRFLKAFFEEGIDLGLPQVTESCLKSLKKLS